MARTVSLFGNIRQPKKRAFLAAYAETGNLSRAATLAQCDRDNHYHWRDAPDPDGAEYRAAFEVAGEMAADALETEARRRAVEGTEKPVYYQGVECGAVREFSDTLLIFLLKGTRPEKYREKFDLAHQLSGEVVVRVEYADIDPATA